MGEENIGNYREILALIRGFDSQFKSIDDRLKETRDDAREARDAAKVLTERFNSQDLPAKLAELTAEVEKGFGDARRDLVNTYDKVTRETRAAHDDHDKRLKSLEDWKHKLDGANGLLGWISKNAPWLLTVVGLAFIALKDKLP